MSLLSSTTAKRNGRARGACIAACLSLAPATFAQTPPPAALDAVSPQGAPPEGSAAPPANAKAADGASSSPGGVAVAEAERRRLRAIQLFDEGDLEAALLEFKRAYELAPTHRLLYNLALVCLRVHDYAAAIGYFERYLRDGADAIEPERRRAVQDKLAEILPRVALVHIHVNVTGARIFVDDRAVGTAPLPAPLRLNAGF